MSTNCRSFTMFQGRVVLTRGQGLGPTLCWSSPPVPCPPLSSYLRRHKLCQVLRFRFPSFSNLIALLEFTLHHSFSSPILRLCFFSKALSAFLAPVFSFFLRQYPHFLRLIAFLLANLLSGVLHMPFHPFLFRYQFPSPFVIPFMPFRCLKCLPC